MSFSPDTIEEKQKFTKYVQGFMRKNLLNRAEVARILTLHPTTVSGWLLGTYTPQISHMKEYKGRLKEWQKQHVKPAEHQTETFAQSEIPLEDVHDQDPDIEGGIWIHIEGREEGFGIDVRKKVTAEQALVLMQTIVHYPT